MAAPALTATNLMANQWRLHPVLLLLHERDAAGTTRIVEASCLFGFHIGLLSLLSGESAAMLDRRSPTLAL